MTIFRKAPPSVVSGYGKRSINLNKFVATFEKHIFLSQTDLTPFLFVMLLSVPFLFVMLLSVPFLFVMVLSVPFLFVMVLSVPFLFVIVGQTTP
jgi:ABC-type Na+ efflux pump permease subunit